MFVKIIKIKKKKKKTKECQFTLHVTFRNFSLLLINKSQN